LTSYLPSSSWEDLYDTAEYGVKFDNKYYAYPILMEPSTLLMYRKDLLLQYGETDQVPTDWDDFLTLLGTIKTNISDANVRGLYPFDVPKGVALGWASWGIQLAATGGFAITDDWTTSRILEPGYTDIANLWQSLYTNRYVPLSSGNYTEVINDLCLDKLVFATAGSWSIATVINDFPDLVDDIGVVPMPTFDGNQEKPTATNGGWTYVISSTSEHKEEAAAVIEFLVASDPQVPIEYFRGARYSKTSPRMSVQEAIIDELATQDIVPSEWIQVLSSVASYAPMEPIYSWDISVAVASMLENVALGNDVASEIQNAHTAINSLITANNLANNNPRDDG
ncbi:MAG: extracellular solute-binding protein, partial [Bacilli bacterium]|nr:extracellular solute-binding protein [Bacilli bacterium]